MKRNGVLLYNFICIIALFSLLPIAMFFPVGRVLCDGEISGILLIPCYAAAFMFLTLILVILKRKNFSEGSDEERGIVPQLFLVAAVNVFIKIFFACIYGAEVDWLFYCLPAVTSVICILVYFAGKKIYSKRTAILISMIVAMAPVDDVKKWTDLRPSGAVLLVSLSVLLLLARKHKIIACVFSGFILFGAFLIDQYTLTLVPGVLMFAAIRAGNSPKRDAAPFYQLSAFVVSVALYMVYLSFKFGEIVSPLIDIKWVAPTGDSTQILSNCTEKLTYIIHAANENFIAECYSVTYLIFVLMAAILGCYVSLKTFRKCNIFFQAYPLCAILFCIFSKAPETNTYLFIYMTIFSGAAAFDANLKFTVIPIECHTSSEIAEESTEKSLSEETAEEDIQGEELVAGGKPSETDETVGIKENPGTKEIDEEINIDNIIVSEVEE